MDGIPRLIRPAPLFTRFWFTFRSAADRPGAVPARVIGARILLVDDEESLVMLCTGYSELISEQTANETGVEAFVLKPLEIKNLAITVRNVLDKTKTSN